MLKICILYTILSPKYPFEVDVIIPVSQMKKLRLRVMKQFAQSRLPSGQ